MVCSKPKTLSEAVAAAIEIEHITMKKLQARSAVNTAELRPNYIPPDHTKYCNFHNRSGHSDEDCFSQKRKMQYNRNQLTHQGEIMCAVCKGKHHESQCQRKHKSQSNVSQLSAENYDTEQLSYLMQAIQLADKGTEDHSGSQINSISAGIKQKSRRRRRKSLK